MSNTNFRRATIALILCIWAAGCPEGEVPQPASPPAAESLPADSSAETGADTKSEPSTLPQKEPAPVAPPAATAPAHPADDAEAVAKLKELGA
ncbi:MAG: hypothetical protein ACK5Q5_06215, partial [Planctomycetaceae bacterium]